jgi:hypothetical protein
MSRIFSRLRAGISRLGVDSDLKEVETAVDAAIETAVDAAIEDETASEDETVLSTRRPGMRRLLDAAIGERFSTTEDLPALQPLVELLRDVARTEFDRETNLNTRAAAVAAVAGLIVTASGAVGKAVFDATEETLTATEKEVSVWLMVVGLVALVAAMVTVVMAVLRPKQAKTRQTFLTDALIDLWTSGHSSKIVCAQQDGLNEVVVDRLLRTTALWSVRNRQKARWLGRAWVLLSVGILLIGVAGLIVVSAELDYSLPYISGMVAAGLALVWFLMKVLYHASRRGRNTERERREKEVERNACRLSAGATRDAQRAGRSG